MCGYIVSLNLTLYTKHEQILSVLFSQSVIIKSSSSLRHQVAHTITNNGILNFIITNNYNNNLTEYFSEYVRVFFRVSKSIYKGLQRHDQTHSPHVLYIRSVSSLSQYMLLIHVTEKNSKYIDTKNYFVFFNVFKWNTRKTVF